MNDECCGNCKYFKNRWKDEDGKCRFEPRPIVKAYDDWCGRWKKK